MGIYSVLYKGKAEVFHGNYADLLLDGKIYSNKQIVVVDDRPGVFYIGNGTNTFAQLTASGQAKRPFATAIVNTAGATSPVLVDAIAGGLITTLSAAAVLLTLPTAALLAARLGGASGVEVQFVVDNSAGANTVTVASGATGVTTAAAVLTGSDTLTVAATAVGIFRLYFTSATAVRVSRVQ